MKKEYNRIKRLSKKYVSWRQRWRLRRIRDLHERTEGLKYLVSSFLKVKHADLEHRCAHEREVSLVLDSKLRLLKSKIRVLEASHSKRDYEIVQSLIDDIEVRLKKCLV